MTPGKVLLWSILLLTPAFSGCLSAGAGFLDPDTDAAGGGDPADDGNPTDADPGDGTGEDDNTGSDDDNGTTGDPDPDDNRTQEDPDPSGNETGDQPGNETGSEGPYGQIRGDDLPAGGVGDEYVLRLSAMRWSKTEITVLIVPPLHHPTGDGPTGLYETRFLRAVEDSIVHWKEAIDQYGSAQLRGNITFDVYVAGRDDFAIDQIETVDIYITNPPGGIALLGLAAYPLSPRCVIANLGLPATPYKQLFETSVHEFGHCLGMSHPGEEVDHAVDHDPWFDVMSYSHINQPQGTPDLALECVSNLNLMAVHEAFGPAFGRSAQTQVAVAADEYALIDCADRFLGS